MALAYQKLNNEGTALHAVKEAVEALHTLTEETGIKPEIYKLARMFAPELTLTPVQFVVDLNESNESVSVRDWSDGNLYYGKWQFSLQINYPASDHSDVIKHATLEFYKDGQQQIKYRHAVMGDSNMNLGNITGDFIGFADFIRVVRSTRLTEGWTAIVEFQGFVLGEQGEQPPAPPTPGDALSLISEAETAGYGVDLGADVVFIDNSPQAIDPGWAVLRLLAPGLLIFKDQDNNEITASSQTIGTHPYLGEVNVYSIFPDDVIGVTTLTLYAKMLELDIENPDTQPMWIYHGTKNYNDIVLGDLVPLSGGTSTLEFLETDGLYFFADDFFGIKYSDVVSYGFNDTNLGKYAQGFDTLVNKAGYTITVE